MMELIPIDCVAQLLLINTNENRPMCVADLNRFIPAIVKSKSVAIAK